MKQYLGIIRDHSMSMGTLGTAALKDYNTNLNAIQEAARTHNVDTIVSVTKCGIGPGKGRVEREIINSNIQVLKPMSYYETTGGSTPLFDSVGDMITLLKQVPDYNDPNVSFMISATTDGQDNDSPIWARKIASEIRELQGTDKWTFVFRVPRGYRSSLASFGIPEGNILEWDQTSQGYEAATIATTSSYNDFYSARSKGVGATRSFFKADASSIDAKKAAKVLNNITNRVTFYPVNTEEEIGDFLHRCVGNWIKGNAFYQLTKNERDVQDYKKICIRNKKSQQVFTGDAVRSQLGLPDYGRISLSPGNHGEWDIFIQSTSSNRKLKRGTNLLYFSVGQP